MCACVCVCVRVSSGHGGVGEKKVEGQMRPFNIIRSQRILPLSILLVYFFLS